MRPRWRDGSDAVLLFVCLWLAYGATITKWNLYDFTLQQAVIDSIVERGTFEVGGSENVMLREAGDKFLFNGRWLPAKQPGQFVIGVPVYFICRLFGLTYAKNYLLAGSIVTWFTASLLSALGSSFFFGLVTRTWGFPRVVGLVSTLCFALATNVFPYSGIAHHDVIALSYLLIAFCMIQESILKDRCERKSRGFGAGVLLGLTLFTSMLPAVLVAVLAVYVLRAARRHFALVTLAGTAVGLLPLALYNWHYFGNPLVQANLAGGYTETVFSPEPLRFLEHLNSYLGASDVSVLKYMPILVLGLAGQWLLGKELRGQAILLASAVALHLLYILNIPFHGACQYGPRLMLPAVPFAMMGLPGLLGWVRSRKGSAAPAILVSLVAVYSLAVNVMGSFVGTMFCETHEFAFLVYLRMPLGAQFDNYPLAIPCLSVLMVLASAGIARLLVATR